MHVLYTSVYHVYMYMSIHVCVHGQVASRRIKHDQHDTLTHSRLSLQPYNGLVGSGGTLPDMSVLIRMIGMLLVAPTDQVTFKFIEMDAPTPSSTLLSQLSFLLETAQCLTPPSYSAVGYHKSIYLTGTIASAPARNAPASSASPGGSVGFAALPVRWAVEKGGSYHVCIYIYIPYLK